MPFDPTSEHPDLIWVQDVPKELGVSLGWVYERLEPKGPIKKHSILGRTYLSRTQVRAVMLGNQAAQPPAYWDTLGT